MRADIRLDSNIANGAQGIGRGEQAVDSERLIASADPFDHLRELNAERVSMNGLITHATNAAKGKLRRFEARDGDDAEQRRLKRKSVAALVGHRLKLAEGRKSNLIVGGGGYQLLSVVERYLTVIDVLALDRLTAVKAMSEIAACLPCAEFVKSVRGFSDLGAAVILAHTGDPSRYPRDGHDDNGRAFTKRLGMAPRDAYPAGKKSTGRIWPRAAFADVYGSVRDPLIRQQWRKGEDDGPGYALGPYGEIYGDEKARALAAGKTKLHADRHARAMATKQLARDLWRQWR